MTKVIRSDWSKKVAIQNYNAQIVVIERNNQISTYTLTNDRPLIFGRAGGANDVSVFSQTVTSQHGSFSYSNGFYTYIDLGSTNGTYINGRKIDNQPRVPSREILLKDGDMLTIAPGNPSQVSMIFSINTNDCTWHSVDLAMVNTVNIGRNENNKICIPNVAVSRNHAVIKREGNGFVIQDLNSVNGTIVNGHILRGIHQLREGDIIQINSTRLIYTNQYIVYNIQNAISSFQPFTTNGIANANNKKYEKPKNSNAIARKGGIEIQVKGVTREVAGDKNSNGSKKKILDNISLTIKKSEFVAILGGSGAGKTTFMNCINGFEPATSGTVLIDGVDLYDNYPSLKSRMGYVPQQDIVHDNLTLKDMLTYTGKLRLPRDDIKSTLDTRVRDVIEMVDLTAQTNTIIKKLSGGQRKRASIAVELLSDPQLMFLDEPTSGLDPEAETSLMRQLRKLSDEGGKTVVVVTHTLQNIKLFDKVIFLAPGGKLCFFGTPDEACRFFEVDNLTDAYRKIINDTDGYVRKFNKIRQGE